MEDPETLAGAHVESPDVTLHILLAPGYSARAVGCAHDDNVLRDDRGRVQSDFARDQIDLLIVVEFQIDNAILSEARHGGSCLRVQRHQTITGRDVQNSFITSVCPIRQAASR